VSSISSWEIRSPRDALPVADVDLDAPVLGDGSRRLLFFGLFFCYTRAPFRWSRDEIISREIHVGRSSRIIGLIDVWDKICLAG